MVAKYSQSLGNGLYTVAEAAFYARVKAAMMSRWLFAVGGKSVIDPQFGFEDRLVSFLDLVQTLAIRDIRKNKMISLREIRNAISVARDQFNMDYPFARKHCTFLLPGNAIAIEPDATKKQHVEVKGKECQYLFPVIAEPYLESIDFDSTGLANKFVVYKSGHKKPIIITMDPQIRFGEPMLPSGYSALTIYDSIRSEGGEKRAAKIYGISEQEAEAAKQFYDYLEKAA